MLELVEETLNEVAFAVEGEIARARGFSVGFGWDDWRDRASVEGADEGVGVEGLVGDESAGVDGFDESFSARQIVILARAELSPRRDCRGRRRARESWWSIRRGIDRWPARRFFWPRAMLVSAHDGGVDHHVFVVVIAGQEPENRWKTLLSAHRFEALIDDLPVAKALGQIAPRDAGAKPEENGFDEQTVARRRAADVAFAHGRISSIRSHGRRAAHIVASVSPSSGRSAHELDIR